MAKKETNGPKDGDEGAIIEEKEDLVEVTTKPSKLSAKDKKGKDITAMDKAIAIENDKELLARIIQSQRKVPYSIIVETIKDQIIYCRSIWGGHLEYRRTDILVEYKDLKGEEVRQVPLYELKTNK